MNWYKVAKSLFAQSAVYEYLKNHPANIEALPKNILPDGFNLVFLNNGWYVLGPDNFLLVNREDKKAHAIALARMRIKYIMQSIKELEKSTV